MTLAKINADKLAGTYTVTYVSREDDAPVDLGGQTVTLTFIANSEGTGGAFSSQNAAVLPGTTDLPATGTWAWPNSTTFNHLIVNPGNIILRLHSSLDSNYLMFNYEATDAKDPDGFWVSVSAQR